MVDKPNMTRIQLGRMLKRLRFHSEMSVADIGREKIMKKSKLYDLEAGKIKEVSWPEVSALARFLGADTQLERVLIEMAKNTLESGWYEKYGIHGNFRLYVELEGTASSIYIYESEFVHGLFQTKEYLKAIKNNDLDVEFRSGRQANVWDRNPTPPTVTFLMNEAVVQRQIGSSDIMAAQIKQLELLGERDNVKLLVVPFSAGYHESMTGSYSIMDFAGDIFPSVTYVETRDGCRYDDTAESVASYRRVFDQTLKRAVPLKEIQL